MNSDRMMTIFFMDGSKVSFEFPEQGSSEMARQFKLEEAFKNAFVSVQAEGMLFVYPVANIKSIQLRIPAAAGKEGKLPKHVIVGATVAD
jgi:hypothetical protein